MLKNSADFNEAEGYMPCMTFEIAKYIRPSKNRLKAIWFFF